MTKSKNLLIVEEIFNSIIHGIAFIVTIIGTVYTTHSFTQPKSLLSLAGWYVFIVTLCLLFLTSTLYHSLSFTKAKKVFQILDYSAIFLFIAGTYTAFIARVLPTITGLICLLTVWSTIVTGIVLRSVFHKKNSPLFILTYALLGWLSLIVIRFGWEQTSSQQLILLIAGGIWYSGGIIVFIMKKIPFSHSLWHLFVIGGALCHYLALVSR